MTEESRGMLQNHAVVQGFRAGSAWVSRPRGQALPLIAAAVLIIAANPISAAGPRSYAAVDTGQTTCYDHRAPIPCQRAGQPWFGQDGNYQGASPQYRDNGDGTVTDGVTGLMWEKGFERARFAEAAELAGRARTGGYQDWRVPTIKELYSLMNFSGSSGRARPGMGGAPQDARPYLDTRYFNFEYPSQGRYIDAQYISSTLYRGMTMGHDRSFFGVNFADGRIKAYPQNGGPGGRLWYLRLVRGNPAYGRNDFVDERNGTVADRATGLTWMQGDSGDPAFRANVAGTARGTGALDWRESLAFCEGLTWGGRADWRLPNAKELQTIVDYERSPSTTGSPAIAPIFRTTALRDADGPDWPYFWSSTTHLDGPGQGDFAVYIAFGEAKGHVSPSMMRFGAAGMGPDGGSDGGRGRMGGPPPGMERPPEVGMGGPPPQDGMGRPPPPMWGGPSPERGGASFGNGGAPRAAGPLKLMDVHGAGAQRSSIKSGDESQLPVGRGPQGDVARIYNYVRCVAGE
jgi:hypothetical protein